MIIINNIIIIQHGEVPLQSKMSNLLDKVCPIMSLAIWSISCLCRQSLLGFCSLRARDDMSLKKSAGHRVRR